MKKAPLWPGGEGGAYRAAATVTGRAATGTSDATSGAAATRTERAAACISGATPGAAATVAGRAAKRVVFDA